MEVFNEKISISKWMIFKSIDDYQKPVNNLKKKDFFNNLKTDSPSDKEI